MIPHPGKKTLILAIMGIFFVQGSCQAEAGGWDDKTFLAENIATTPGEKTAKNAQKTPGNDKNKPEVDITKLLEQLSSNDMEVRLEAVAKLGQSDDEDAWAPLQVALKDPDEAIRQAAAEAMGNLGDPKAVSPLQAVVKRDKGELVRAAAVKSLGMLGQKRASVTLRTAITKDESELVRTEAIKALGQLGDKRAAKALAKIVLKSKDQNMRFTAAEALGELGDKRVIKKTVIFLLNQPIEPKKDERQRHVMVQRADLIAKIGPGAIPPLIAAMKKSKHATKDMVLMALGRIRDKRAIVALVTATKTGDRSERWHATRGLALIGDKRALPHIIPLLKDKEPDVRTRAFRTLAQLDRQKAVPILIKAVPSEKNDHVRAYLVDFIGWIGDERGEEIVTKSLKDKDPHVREMAKRAIDRIERAKKRREEEAKKHEK